MWMRITHPLVAAGSLLRGCQPLLQRPDPPLQADEPVGGLVGVDALHHPVQHTHDAGVEPHLGFCQPGDVEDHQGVELRPYLLP